MPERIVTSRTPVRVDFAGSWTDVPRFTDQLPGLVVNAAITVFTYVTVKQCTGREIKATRYGYPTREEVFNESIHMYSVDLGVGVHAKSIGDIEYDGTMDLVKAACRRLGIDGIEIVTRSGAPPGSGLGTSASLGVAAIGALMQYAGKPVVKRCVADTAYRLEVEELKLLSGTQDQYAATYGGFSSLECYGERVLHDQIPVKDNIRYDLEKRLILCYTGHSRLSSSIHVHVTEGFDAGKNHFPLTKLVNTAELARDALWTGDIDVLAQAMNRSWVWQKELHPSVTNDTIEMLFTVALENGMQAGKACGAGGGGCLLFLAKSGEEHILRRALEDNGGEILDFSFDDRGLCVWE